MAPRQSLRPADFSPDAALYHDAVARLDATIAALPAFEVHLRRFRKMQGRLVEACARGGSRRARLGRDAGACLYGDQGCGYRCIDEWAAERAKRLAERRDRGNSPFVDRAREMAREAAAPAPDSPFIDRAREMARGKEILEAEEEHVDWLETQLSLIDRVGEQNYLQTAMKTVKPD